MAGLFCPYCYRPDEIGGHNEGCPVLIGTPEAMATWKRGFDYGYGDNCPVWYAVRHHTPTFMFGWRAGYDDLNEMIELASENRFDPYDG